MVQATIVFDYIVTAPTKKKKKKRKSTSTKLPIKKRSRQPVDALLVTKKEDELFLDILPDPKFDKQIEQFNALNAHDLDSTIHFVDEGHIYYVRWQTHAEHKDAMNAGLGSCEGIISVSGVIARQFDEFDADKVIAKMKNGRNFNTGKYAGMSAEAIKKQWDDKGQDARDRGTAYHLVAEAILCGFVVVPGSPIARCPEVQQFMSWWLPFKQGDLIVYRTEWQMRSDIETRLVGTADFVLVNKHHGTPEETNGVLTLTIGDHKRSAKIKRSNHWQKGRPTGCASGMDDCSFVKYSFQYSQYAWLLETYYRNPRFNGHVYDRVVIDAGFLIVVHPERSTYERVDLVRHYDVVADMIVEQRAIVAGL